MREMYVGRFREYRERQMERWKIECVFVSEKGM